MNIKLSYITLRKEVAAQALLDPSKGLIELSLDYNAISLS